MADPHNEYERIKEFLKHEPRGMNIREISKGLGINRNSVAKYLDILTSQEEVEVRFYGKSKIYNLSQRVPLSGLLKFSSSWIIIVNRDLRIVQVNEAFLRRIRLPKERVLHKRITDIPATLCSHRVIPELAGKALAGTESHGEICIGTGPEPGYFEITATPTSFQDNSAGAILALEDITGRKVYETALKQSEEKFRNLVETSTDWIWEVDRNGVYTYCSPQVKEILGFEPGEIAGKAIFDLMPPDEAVRVSQIFSAASGRGEPVFCMENVNLHKDGHPVTLETNGMPFRNQAGEVAGYRGIDRDITERKKAESLASRYQFLQQLIDAIPNPVFFKDRDRIYRGCNRAFEAICGRRRSEIIGKSVHDIYPKQYADTYSLMDNRLFNNPGTQTYEYAIVDSAGAKRDVIYDKATFCDIDGTIVGIVGVIRDITARKQAEEALRESEERYRTVFETCSTATVIIEPDTTISLANSRFAALSGFRAEEIVGKKSWTEFVVKEDLDRMMDQHRIRREQCSGARDQYEFRFLTRTGEIRDIILSVSLIPGTGQSVASLMDITERKRLESRLAEVNNAFLSFSPDPVHNITILTGLAGKLLGGTCALYNRLDDGMLCSLGAWNTPEDFVRSDRPEGHICHDIIQKEESSPVVFTNLQETEYARTDPNVQKYNLHTYVGIPVKIGTSQLGALCVVFRQAYTPSLQDLEFLSFLAKAVAVEDERRMALVALRESEERYSVIVNNTPGPVLTTKGGIVRFINDAGTRLSGYSRDEISGRSIIDFLTGDSKEVARRVIQFHANEGKGCGFEVGFVKKDGSVLRVLVRTMNITDNGETITLVLLIDITEMMLAQQALLASETRYRTLAENAPVGILVAGRDGKITYINKKMLAMLGSPSSEKTKEINLLEYPPLVASGFSAALKRCFDTTDTSRIFETEYRSRWGKTGYFRGHITPLDAGPGEDALVICDDITDRRLAEMALKETTKKLNLLSGITRHDIRNQIVALSAYLFLAEESEDDREKTAECFSAMKSILQTLSRQIEFTRDYEDIGVAVPAWQQVAAVMRSACSSLRMNGVRFEIDCPGLEVYADPLLERVFSNLIEHSLHFGGKSLSTVRVTTAGAGEDLRLFIEDDGNGISPEERENLFSKGVAGNTGPGLFLSREILSITGITVAETGLPGRGGRFELTIPHGAYRFGPGTVNP